MSRPPARVGLGGPALGNLAHGTDCCATWWTAPRVIHLADRDVSRSVDRRPRHDEQGGRLAVATARRRTAHSRASTSTISSTCSRPTSRRRRRRRLISNSSPAAPRRDRRQCLLRAGGGARPGRSRVVQRRSGPRWSSTPRRARRCRRCSPTRERTLTDHARRRVQRRGHGRRVRPERVAAGVRPRRAYYIAGKRRGRGHHHGGKLRPVQVHPHALPDRAVRGVAANSGRAAAPTGGREDRVGVSGPPSLTPRGARLSLRQGRRARRSGSGGPLRRARRASGVAPIPRTRRPPTLFEVALRHFDRMSVEPDPSVRADVMLFPRSIPSTVGSTAASRDAAPRAAWIALANGDVATATHTFVTTGRGFASRIGEVDEEQVQLLENGLRLAGEGDSIDRAMLPLARLGARHCPTPRITTDRPTSSTKRSRSLAAPVTSDAWRSFSPPATRRSGTRTRSATSSTTWR